MKKQQNTHIWEKKPWFYHAAILEEAEWDEKMIIWNLIFCILLMQELLTACYTTFPSFTNENLNRMGLFANGICICTHFFFFLVENKLFSLIHGRNELSSHQHPQKWSSKSPCDVGGDLHLLRKREALISPFVSSSSLFALSFLTCNFICWIFS